MMFDINAKHRETGLLGNVGRQVGDPFKVFADTDDLHAAFKGHLAEIAAHYFRFDGIGDRYVVPAGSIRTAGDKPARRCGASSAVRMVQSPDLRKCAERLSGQ